MIQYFQFFDYNMICLDVQATGSWCHVFHIICFAFGNDLMELVLGKLVIFDMGGLIQVPISGWNGCFHDKEGLIVEDGRPLCLLSTRICLRKFGLWRL